MSPDRLLVAIATFRRPDDLSATLRSLEQQVDAPPFDVVVVDNDPDGGAQGVVTSFEPLASYLHEPQPGIAAARNKALEFVGPQHWAVCFIDDDEVASPTWMRALALTASERDAAIVVGAVHPVLPPGCPRWVDYLGFFERPTYAEGEVVRWPATNNALVRVDAIGEDRFAEEFSMTGGSDADFFWRLRSRGHLGVWSAEGSVTESIPASRATFSWLWRRGTRLGNVSGRLLVRQRSRWQVALIAVLRLGFGVMAALVIPIVPSWRRALILMNIPKAVGTWQSLKGNLVEEYSRG